MEHSTGTPYRNLLRERPPHRNLGHRPVPAMTLPAPLPIQPHQERQTVSHTRIKKTGTYLRLGHLRINLPLCFIVIVVVMALGWWDHLRIHRYVPRGFVCDVGQDDERAGLGRLQVAHYHHRLPRRHGPRGA